jgi:hypothetical protein
MTSNVIPLNDMVSLTVFTDTDGNSGITHDEWTFTVIRVDDKIAIVDKKTGEIEESMDAGIFNAFAYYWLVLDEPELFDGHVH